MDKHTLESILEQVCQEEFSEFSEPPKHRFRLKNRIRIRRVLAEFRRNSTACLPARRMNRRLATAMLVVILLAVMAVTTAAVLLLRGFIAEEHEDNTQLFAENIAGAPTTIEEVYYISELPEGYEPKDHIETTVQSSTIYYSKDMSDFICFDQHVKINFNTYYDNNVILPINIGKYDGVYIDHSTDKQIMSCVIWDNGDYIMQLEGTISKEDIIALAESVKK